MSLSRSTAHAFEHHRGAASRALPPGYQPRRPEATALYGVVAEHLETMLDQARERSAHGFGLPRHVEQSFRRFLDCGVLERGFCRVVCASCQYETLVPFSCKARGLCASCDGRRMADCAAHLVDHVMPLGADYRQWTLSFPRDLRFRLLRDPSLVSEILGAFVRIVFAFHRRRARSLRIPVGHAGAVSAIQRFGSFLNANLHFHTLIPDGVFEEMADGSVLFHALPPPSDDDVQTLAARIVRRTARILARRDRDNEPDDEPPDALAQAQAESVTAQLALPAERGPSTKTTRTKRLCAVLDGFSLHAATAVDATDRAALERLLRYILRPAISASRVTVRPDGRVEYRYRKPDPSGRTSWVTDGVELCRRLATLVPPARTHGVRFHGVLASAHRLRPRVVPTPPVSAAAAADAARPPISVLARRLDWAQLLRRVFGDDVTACPRCGDNLRILAFITDHDVTRKILDHLRIPSTTIPITPARPPPQSSFPDDPAFDPFDTA